MAVRKRRSHPLQANGGRNQGLLVRMTERLFRCDTSEHAIWTMLDDAIALLGAEYENVQRLIGVISDFGAARSPARFLKSFRRVRQDDGSACGRALRLGKPVVIPNLVMAEPAPMCQASSATFLKRLVPS